MGSGQNQALMLHNLLLWYPHDCMLSTNKIKAVLQFLYPFPDQGQGLTWQIRIALHALLIDAHNIQFLIYICQKMFYTYGYSKQEVACNDSFASCMMLASHP